MKPSIRAICFDVGGTLRTSRVIDKENLDHIIQIQSFVGNTDDPREFLNRIRKGEKEYRRWCKKSLLELSEADLWTEFMLPDFPKEFIRDNAVKLNQMWRSSRFKEILPDAVDTIKALAERGYKLAIISNTTSSIEVPQLLKENEISDLFETVILSTVAGRRKPHPVLFLDAARKLGLAPEQCAYVGDRLSRDLIGARQSGYSEVVIINVLGYQTDEFDPDDEPHKETILEMKPDFYIGRLEELLEIYPHIHPDSESESVPRFQPDHLYDIALSTMWNVDQKMSFNDTFIEARKLGFARFELNHKISPELYKQWDSNRFYISSVHDPCPAVYSYDEMKYGDIQISSLNETRRIKGVDLIKSTIDLACKLGSLSVVVHPGSVIYDRGIDKQLRKLYQNGLSGTTEYKFIQSEMFADRSKMVPPYLEQVVKSLEEIISFSRNTGISIGLENRFRYFHIPIPDEMELFLNLCREDWFGFQYDVGHAHTLDVLGLVSHQEWLNRFGNRMVGVHFHDVVGVTDHQIPGRGEVNFKKLAAYIPDGVYKTLEIGPQASPDEIKTGLETLVESGCICRL